MTDVEKIIKALKNTISENEYEYYHSNTMGWYADLKNALELIVRLKSDNEKLQAQVNRLRKYDAERDTALHGRLVKTARCEAFNEFAEKLKDLYTGELITDDMHCPVEVIKANIDDVLEELISNNN